MDLENACAWRVSIHQVMGQEKEIDSGGIWVLMALGWTEEL